MKKIILLSGLLSSIIFFSCSSNGGRKTIEESGTIEATEATISSQATGKIIKIIKDEGAQIAAGDTILIIDHELLGFQLSQMEASRDIAKAQLDLLIKGSRKEDIQQAEEALNQAESNFETAKSDKERMDALYKTNAITKKQFEDASSRFDVTQAQLSAARENLKKIKNIARPEEIVQAKANFQKSEAAAESIKKNIRDCYVLSPTNGFVVKKFVETGETVSMLSSLVKVADLSKVKLVVYISEKDLGLIKLGQKVDVTVDSYPGKNFEGSVIYISPEAEFTPKTIQTKDERTKLVFAVKIEIPNPGFELKTGMPADATIIVQ
jgi:HlyD family secretion protein